MNYFHPAPRRWPVSAPLVRAWILPLRFSLARPASFPVEPPTAPFAEPDDSGQAGDNVIATRFGADAATASARAGARAVRPPLWPGISEPRLPAVRWPFAPGSRGERWGVRRLAEGAIALVVGGTLIPVVALPVLAGVAIARHDEVFKRHQGLMASATGVQVRDASGRLVAVEPAAKGDRVVLRVGTAPRDFSQMLTTLEDRHARGIDPRHLFGLDVGSLLATPVCRSVERAFRLACGGTSSLEMQAVRGSYGWVGGRGSGGTLRHRKMTEILDTLSLSLDGGPEDPKMAAFIADRLVYGFGTGPSIWGLQTASQVLFGVDASKLSLAQQAVLAAAPNIQFRLVCDNAAPADRLDAARRWARIQRRADRGLRDTFRPNAAVEFARREVMAMPVPGPHTLDADLAAGLTAAQACEAAGNLTARGGLIASGVMIAARPEIVALEKAGGGVVTDVDLTVDVAHNRRFRQEVEDTLQRMQHDQRSALHIALVGKAARKAAVAVVVAAPDGRITQIYANSARPLLDEPRPAGSLGKLAVALAAANAHFNIDEPLCNRMDALTGIHNADGAAGSATCSGRALVPWETAFGRSMNLPVLDLARRVPPERLRAAAAAYGLTLPGDAAAPNAITLGEATLTPRQALANAAAIAAGAAGRPARGDAPHLVARARIGGRWVARQPIFASDFSSAFGDARQSALMMAAAGGALRTPGGTLTGTVTRESPLSAREIGKSGTVAGPAPEHFTIAKLAMGGGAGAEDRTWFGVIGAPDHDLGVKVSGLELWKLARRWAVHADASAPPSPVTPPAMRGVTSYVD